MDVSKGLSFQEARQRISSTFHDILESSETLVKENVQQGVWPVLQYLCVPSLMVASAYLIAILLSKSEYRVEWLITILAIVILAFINFAVVHLYQASEDVELKAALQSVLAAFDEHCEQAHKLFESDHQPGPSKPCEIFSEANTYLTSGHSQVSVVHTYRDGQWLRIPVLLLAEGDIIALMGGDVTPAKCYEIDRRSVESTHVHMHSHHNMSIGSESKTEIQWNQGKLMEAGEKVLIRNKRYFSQQCPTAHGEVSIAASTKGAVVPNSGEILEEMERHTLDYGNRHRTLGAESVEILGLSGDVRCFRMAETPVAPFLRQTVLGQMAKSGEQDEDLNANATGGRYRRDYAVLPGEGGSVPAGEQKQQSLVRSIFRNIVVESGGWALFSVFIGTGIGMLVRYLSCHTVQRGGLQVTKGLDWAVYVVGPTATACLFFLPLALPITLVIAEASATADVLATAEVTLRPAKAATPPSPSSWMGSAWIYATGMLTRNLYSAASATSSRQKLQTQVGHRNSTDGTREEDGSLLEDQFLDDDIDERVDDIAEEVSTQVKWSRYLAYFCKVIFHRLFLHWMVRAAGDQARMRSASDADYLPIPMARTRLLEVLGAVTMVCFVDDDVICEGYSVTEEIFLLMEDNQANQGNGERESKSPRLPIPRGMETSADSAEQERNALKSKQANVKGVVLDLHANPEATGSRFENPQWWRYLPSLKPLGLNAMLTYSYGAAAATLSSATPDYLSNSADKTSGQIEGKGLRLKGNSSFSLQSVAENRPMRSSTISHQHSSSGSSNNINIHNSGSPYTSLGRDHDSVVLAHQQQQQQHTERSLVRHIRHLLPQESLRELAEEIGFDQSDLSPFSRVLEVNVLAPGLENAHLLEDTHQWGQEESRRRGSLLPQLRGGVYRDFRDGSLQMMSLGDPSLVLNYCREYWDGSTRSITPLSSGDRAEVLNVYERWRLEDFEVVAFCYSPLPTAGLNPLLSSSNKDDVSSAGCGHSSTPSSTRHSSNSVSAVSGAFTLVGRNSNSGHNSSNFSSVTSPVGALKPHGALGVMPFPTSKHSTLFFVDPITTQDLQRVAAGITRKSKEKVQGSSFNPSHTSVASKPTSGGSVVNGRSGRAGNSVDDLMSGRNGTRSNKASSVFVDDVRSNSEDDRDEDDDDMLLHEEEGMKRSSTLNPKALSSKEKSVKKQAVVGLVDEILSDSGDDLREGHEHDRVEEGLLKRSTTLDPKALTNRSAAGETAEKLTVIVEQVNAEQARDRSKIKSLDEQRSCRTLSRIDASYMNAAVAILKNRDGGGALVKSMSLDRMAQYSANNRDAVGDIDEAAHQHLYSTAPSADNTNRERSTSSADPGSLPSPLRTSTSAKELGEKVIEPVAAIYPTSHRAVPQSPMLMFPEDDDESSSIITDSGVTVESRTSTPPVDCRRGIAIGELNGTDSGDLGSGNSSSAMKRSASQSGISFQSPAPITVSFDDGELSNNARSSGVKSSGGLTPPLVPRATFSSTRSISTIPHSVGSASGGLRKHASAFAGNHPFLGHSAASQGLTAKQRLQQQQQRSHQQSRQLRRASTRQLWTLMRQQVFLGMAASSVPVRKDVPNVKEDLDTAGVRFVYFSAQNMKRSKPVAERIGIPFDWNCAISLRELEGDTAQDPHRHISNYADWDVLARMPHGIDAIKKHLETVDNVPLLVSLFTDATPRSVRQMVEVFRDNGEVVLTIGGGYRSNNLSIYNSADLGCSVSVLPGVGSTSLLPANEEDLIRQFPMHSCNSLNRADILLSFRLIGLTTINFLQTPYRQDLMLSSSPNATMGESAENPSASTLATPGTTSESPLFLSEELRFPEEPLVNPSTAESPEQAEQLRLSVLMEVIHKGRVILRNMIQALAFYCVATLSLGLWPLATLAVPISLPAAPSAGIALLFVCVYVPALCLTLLQCGEPEGVMKNTPRKNLVQRRPRDLQRFMGYLALRCGYLLFSIVVVGWFGAASTMKSGGQRFGTSLTRFYFLNADNDADCAALRLVQDLMSAQALLSLVSQSSTLLVRGQHSLSQFAWPWRLPGALFYAVSLLLIAVHSVILSLREYIRTGSSHGHTYTALDWPVWLAMALLPTLGVAFGVLVNRDDDRHHRRYLQFLRLEFETRLGMHSPR